MVRTLDFLIRHGYVVLFVWILAEQGAVPLPSIPLLLACGALARAGKLSLAVAMLYGLAGCLVADNVWFQLGRVRGGRILRFLCRVSLEPDSCVRQTENAFLRYGLRSLLVSKFVPGLNAVAAPMAGSSGARRTQFLLYDTLGALLWLGTYAGLGYLFSDQLEVVAAYALRMGSWLVVIVIASLAAWIAWKFIQRQRFLHKLSVARITPEELRDLIDSGEDVMILDVRQHVDPDDASIPGALHISLEELSDRHGEIPRDRDIVLFCS